MEERTATHRKPQGTNYRLNVIQIPLLRGLGSLVLCLYVLLYELLDPAPFSLSHYLVFVGIFAAYCLGSWLILRAGYKKVRRLDLTLFFLIVDLVPWLLAIYWTGA